MSTATGEVKAGRAYVEILLDQTKLERGLKQAQQKIRSFGSALTGIGKNMLAVSGVLAAPMAFATKTFADFDDAMRMVKAVSGATEGEFKRLTAAAEKLGRETSYTAKEVAEGMTAMGRMGLKPDEILSAVPAAVSTKILYNTIQPGRSGSLSLLHGLLLGLYKGIRKMSTPRFLSC